MKLFGILGTLFFLCGIGFALRCMNCTSSTHAPLAGCDGEFTPGFLIECPDEEGSFCQVLRYRGAHEGIGIVQYDRICSNDFREECAADIERDGVTCIYSCQQDGCNSMNVFPNEPEYSTPAPPTITTVSTITTPATQQPLICYNCTSDPDDPSGDCGGRMSDDSIIECHPEERFCLVSKVFSSESYVRTCSHMQLNECEDYDYEGFVCHRTCTTDGCNDFIEFPDAPGKLEDVAQTTTTTDTSHRVATAAKAATAAPAVTAATSASADNQITTRSHSDSVLPRLSIIVALAGLVFAVLKI